MKRLMSGLLAASLAMSMLPFSAMATEEPVLQTPTENVTEEELPSYGGAITSIVTMNPSAFFLEYVERTTLKSIGKMANMAGDTPMGNALSLTKRVLGNPQSTALANISAMCEEILAEIEVLSAEVQQCNAKIDNLQLTVDTQHYETYRSTVRDFGNTYMQVYNMYQDLVIALQEYSDAPEEDKLDKVRQQYNSIRDMYTTNESNRFGNQTQMTYNFWDDLDKFLAAISPYEYGQRISQNVLPSDSSAWGNNTGNTTYLSALHTCLTDKYSFEHDIYNGMEYGINEAAGYAAVYLNAYRMYVEFGAQLVNSDPAMTEEEKTDKIKDLWDDYNTQSYRLMRGMEQMLSLYSGEMATLMRPYDVNFNLGIDYKAKRTGTFEHVQIIHNTWSYTLNAKKTQQFMAFYQVKPYGSERSYAILKDSSGGNATIKMNDMVDVLMECPKESHTSISADFVNLSNSYSPAYYKMPSDVSELSGLYNARNYSSNIYALLQNQGLTQLPSLVVNSDAEKGTLIPMYASLNNLTLHDGVGDSDQDIKVMSASAKINTSKPNDSIIEVDTEDDIRDSDGNHTQPLVILTSAKPLMALNTTVNGDGSAEIYKVGDDSTKCTNSNQYAATQMVAKVKPGEGQSIKSINLVLPNSGNSISLAGASLTDEETACSVEEALTTVQQDADGNYLFYFSIPYQNARLEVTFGEADPAVQLYDTVLNQKTADEKTHGEILFANGNGLTQKSCKVGEDVNISVRAYTGYVVDSVTVTQADGTAVELMETTDNNLRLTPNSHSYSFKMPNQSVSVSAIYEQGHVVTLDQNLSTDNGALKFGNIQCLNEEWLTYPMTYRAGDTVTIASQANTSYYTSEYDIMGLTTYDSVDARVSGNTITFTMPEEDVVVSASYEKPAGHTVKLESSGAGDLYFVNKDGDKVISAEKYFENGDTVKIMAVSDSGNEPTVIVSDISGAGIECTQDSTNKSLYSFTMGTKNVIVTVGWQLTGTSFTDVPPDEYYSGAVRWAVRESVVEGTSKTTFSPNEPCTRAQAVTFLWRLAGSPKPTETGYAFTDTDPDAYYYNAVQWAVEQGITIGTSDTTFSPDDLCTRAQNVTFLWRMQGSEPVEAENPFTDVADDYYRGAVLWAIANNITQGTTETTFAPDAFCTRAQFVTFLYRVTR